MEADALPRTGRRFLPRSRKVLAAFSDERLVEQVRRGNEAAFEAIFDRHHRGILSFCRHMLASPDEAEDAVQQTFISAFDAVRADARDIRLKPWLYTIARNRCLSTLRSRREHPSEIDVVPTARLTDEVQQRADLRELLDDLHRLPVDQRAALVLSEVGDLSHAEVGAVVGCEVARVKSLVFQARSSLIESRRAREIPCAEIREQLATATGGALRRGPLRRHLRTCPGCAEFRDQVMRQRRALAAVLPVLPTLGLKKSALAAIGVGGGGAGGAAVGVGGGIASLASSSAAVKVVAAVVVASVAVGGGLILDRSSHAPAAQAAGGQPGGGQAWPAPPAGTGPGVRLHLTVRHRPAHNPRVRAKRRGQARRGQQAGTPPRSDALVQGPNARGGSTQPRGIHHSPGAQPTPQAAPPQPSPATPAPVSAPTGGDGHQHVDNGNHVGREHSSHGGQGGDGVPGSADEGGGSSGGDHHGDGGGDHHSDGGGGHD
jgi:RNA polymerase sigma factor (sigma-70 family)